MFESSLSDAGSTDSGPCETGPHETIVAVATPWGRGGVSVLRLSGPEAGALADLLCPGGPDRVPRRATLRKARDRDGRVLDEVLLTWMPGPKSYTGEDIVELGCHGNPVLVDQLIERSIALGARQARPGEFTRRALEHGRLDLVQAEAVAALIDARTRTGAALAQRVLSGDAGKALIALRDAILDIAAELEARLDHPDDALGYTTDQDVVERLRGLARGARTGAANFVPARARLSGARVALMGPVNAGKSSLFNHLLGQRRALVSPEAGTTRDVVESRMVLDGVEVCLMDTAGCRERLADAGAIEQAGLALGAELTADVDLCLWVQRPDQHFDPPPGPATLQVFTHADVSGLVVPTGAHWVSSRTGQGLEALKQALRDRVAGQAPAAHEVVALTRRQQRLLEEIAGHLEASAEAFEGALGLAVAAAEVAWALDLLAELDGSDAREEVLDRLFQRFCVGK